MDMPNGDSRDLGRCAPALPSRIIPSCGFPETWDRSELRLSASLLVVIVILVGGVVALPVVWPTVSRFPFVWPVLVSALLSLVAVSSQSYIRVVRTRRI
ncbi:hypothetical protein ACH4TU_33575 [Streptomyces physcomitrii]|uniref:hypothetical protein n=1 Tax=Streptomyces physcomitrii TaxID=2724184 RepID=UPI0011AB57E5